MTDFAFSSHDRLLQEVRWELRRVHGFPRGKQPFGVECVISREPPIYAREDGSVCATAPADKDLRLDCNRGLGTASFVTGTFAFVATARIVGQIAA